MLGSAVCRAEGDGGDEEKEGKAGEEAIGLVQKSRQKLRCAADAAAACLIVKAAMGLS